MKNSIFFLTIHIIILVMCSVSTEMARELAHSKLKIDYRFFVDRLLVDIRFSRQKLSEPS